jgi:hypothetical protein
LVPLPQICLANLIITRAIKDDAFEPSFKTVDEFLNRPNLEGVDFLPLKWKKKKLDQRIFKIDYRKFNAIFHRTTLVAGFRKNPRLYALRVGAAGRLDGK